MPRPKLWVTYAWKDNETQNVDYIIQELSKHLEVHYDRLAVAAGKLLWDEFDKNITDPAKCDAWLGIVSEAALESSAWNEERFYAFDRTLQSRGKFPMMFLVLGKAPPKEKLPAAMRVRLYVSTAESHWAEKIVAGAEARAAEVAPTTIGLFDVRGYRIPNDELMYEFTLRAGAWNEQWFVGESAAHASIQFVHVNQCNTPLGGAFMMTWGNPAIRGPHKAWPIGTALNPTVSAYVRVNQVPPILVLGRSRIGEEFRILEDGLRALQLETRP